MFDKVPTSRAELRAQIRAAMTLSRNVVKIGSAEEREIERRCDAAHGVYLSELQRVARERHRTS